MRITSKGQVTIPISIREKMGLLPHTEVEFAVRGNAVYLKKHSKKNRSGRGVTLIGRMRGKGTVRMTTDDIMALTRGA